LAADTPLELFLVNSRNINYLLNKKARRSQFGRSLLWSVVSIVGLIAFGYFAVKALSDMTSESNVYAQLASGGIEIQTAVQIQHGSGRNADYTLVYNFVDPRNGTTISGSQIVSP
jgi:hypothetical protein